MTSTLLITGASRGIGLCLTATYAKRGWEVIATCRNPDSAGDLQQLVDEFPNISLHRLDVSNLDEIRALAEELSEISIDVLMNNAAMLGDPEEQSVDRVDYDLFTQIMKTNTFAPLLMSECFLEQVVRSEQKKIVTLTSGLSSIAFTEQFGRLYFYRASKAAINVAMRAFNADVKDRGVIVNVVAPGLVNTALLQASGYQGGSIEPSEAAENLFTYIENLAPNKAEGFDVPPGRVLPW